ncbi:MAG TPA: acyl-CoA thioesterase [Candidatus Eisenbacteria bacterium]|jgi:acyl-CoA hydrolase|nr:acyl-CoA thioesterase [Candidatus Eisenbacteria bacterium]
MVQLVLPNDANTMGNVLGGMVLHWIDLAAAVVAHRHCRNEAVTASIDQVSFLAPIKVGQLAMIAARMTGTGKTSMEIRVDVQSEDLLSGERRQTLTAYLTFVAVDGKGRPRPVPPLIPETEDERREARNAERRRVARLSQRDTPQGERELR